MTRKYSKFKYKKSLLSATLATSLFLILPHPVSAATITSVAPNIVNPGETELVISGTGFGTSPSYAGSVCFTEKIISYFSLPCIYSYSSELLGWSDTSIRVKVPSDTSGYMAGGAVQITTSSYNTVTAYYHLQPQITDVDSNIVVPGQSIRVSGKYFKDMFGVAAADSYSVKVYFNGKQATVDNSSWTGSTMTVTVPDGATSGNITADFTLASSGLAITATGPAITVLAGSSHDPYSPQQQYLKTIKIEKAWPLVGGYHQTVVAVIDDGVYINHPDLRNQIWQNFNEKKGNQRDDDNNGYVDDYYGYDFLNQTGEMTTTGTHGTMVAGIIAASNDNNEGITGINPNVTIMPLIACDNTGCDQNAVIKAIHYAVDNGASIINLSLGTFRTSGYTNVYDSAVKYAYDHNVVIVVAAGNGDVEGGQGQDLGVIPQSPVCNDIGKNAVVGVAASTTDGVYRTTWSNYGACADVYAPGVEIASTGVPVYSNDSAFSRIDSEGFYLQGNGTSFSAPIVTGVISLLREKYPTIPIKEIQTRLLRDSENGIINAEKFLSDSYTPPLAEREAALNNGVNVDTKLTEKMKGSLLLQVENGGKVWYVSPKDGKRYEVTQDNVMTVFRKLSFGITNSNLKKIPTEKQKSVNSAFIASIRGKLQLQVQDRGRIWYVNPKDGKRYEVTQANALNLFRKLSVGVSNQNLRKIRAGLLE